ncbi:hypothetical protein HLH33_08575, partial [Gluconacetobacter diazotrophicus]
SVSPFLIASSDHHAGSALTAAGRSVHPHHRKCQSSASNYGNGDGEIPFEDGWQVNTGFLGIQAMGVAVGGYGSGIGMLAAEAEAADLRAEGYVKVNYLMVESGILNNPSYLSAFK